MLIKYRNAYNILLCSEKRSNKGAKRLYRLAPLSVLIDLFGGKEENFKILSHKAEPNSRMGQRLGQYRVLEKS